MFEQLPLFVPSEDSGYPGMTQKEVSERTQVFTGTESMVQQQFADEVDINSIMRRFMASGTLPAFRSDGVYGDFSDVYDYETAVEKVKAVEDKFMTLPAELRAKFENDPQQLLLAVQGLTEDQFNDLVSPPKVEVSAVVPPVG